MMANNTFGLKWNDYCAALTNELEALRHDADFADVTLGCQGKKLSAHKVLLAACSPFFRELLRSNRCQHPIIVVRETSAHDLEAILKFMYHGEVSVAEADLDSFLKSAAALEISGLTEYETEMSNASGPSSRKKRKRQEDHPKMVAPTNGLVESMERGPEGLVEASMIEAETVVIAEHSVKHSTLETSAIVASELTEVAELDINGDRISCIECGKHFQTKNALADHEKMHKGLTSCTICGKIFSTQGNMKRHMDKAHPQIGSGAHRKQHKIDIRKLL